MRKTKTRIEIFNHVFKSVIMVSIFFLISNFKAMALGSYSNNTQYLIGDKAAGLGGAFTAVANDSTSAYYNPAGLADIKSFTLNISANTYSYMKTQTDGYTELPTSNGKYKKLDLKESDFSVVANTLVYGQKLDDKQGFAAGIFIPNQDTLLGKMEAKNINLSNSEGTMNYTDSSVLKSRYYLLLAGYGRKINDSLNAGLTLGLGYYNLEYKGTTIYAVSGEQNYRNLSAFDETYTESQYVMRLSPGIQYSITPNNKIGIYVQSPTWRLYGNWSDKTISYDLDNESDDFYEKEWGNVKGNDEMFKQMLPASCSIGYGYQGNGYMLTAQVDPVFPLKDQDLPNMVVNYKAGFEYVITNNIILRSGFFTDFSQKAKVKKSTSVEDGTDKIDYYGVVISFSIGKSLEMKQGYETLWSTFGVAGRYGIGDVKTTRLKDSESGTEYEEVPLVKKKTVINAQFFISETIAFN